MPETEDALRENTQRPPSGIVRKSAVWIVFGVWVIQAIHLLLFICYAGPDLLLEDDYRALDIIRRQDPAAIGTYWQRLNEHRLPAALLILSGLSRAGVTDFQWYYFANWLCLNLAALILLLAFRRARGRTSVVDLAIPLSVLSPTHMISVVMILGLFFDLYFLVCALMLSAISLRFWQGGRWFTVWLFALVLLPISGGMGLGVAGPVTLYSLFLAWRLIRSETPGERGRGVALARASLIAGLFGAAYVFSGPSLTVEHHPAPQWGVDAWLAGLRALGMACGMIVAVWVKSHPGVFHASVVAFLAFFAASAVWSWWRSSAQRTEILG